MVFDFNIFILKIFKILRFFSRPYLRTGRSVSVISSRE